MSENIPKRKSKPEDVSQIPVKIDQEIGKAAADLVKKQLMLSNAKTEYDRNVANAKQSVNYSMERIIQFAQKSKTSLMEQIDNMSSRRRLEMELMNTALIEAQSKILKLFANYASNRILNRDEKDATEDIRYLKCLTEVQSFVNTAFTGEQWEKEAITEIEVYWNDFISQIIDSEQMSLHKFVRVNNYISPEELSLKLLNFAPEELKLDVSIESSDKSITKVLLTEINLEIHTVRNTIGSEKAELLNNIVLYRKTSIKELISEGKANFENNQRIIVSCPIDLSILNEEMLLIQVELSGVPIHYSPLTLHTENERIKTIGNDLSPQGGKPNNMWRSFSFSKDNGCPTRNGKATCDLDQSDMRALGYSEQTPNVKYYAVNPRRLSTVLESHNENPSTEDAEINESYSNLPKEKLAINNQLPLNQPSPVTYFKKPLSINSTNTIAVASPTQNNFLPSIKSTDKNLEKRLKEFNEMKDHAILSENNTRENGNESFDVLEADSQCKLDISHLQARLSGKFNPAKNVNHAANEKSAKTAEKTRKNVSFHNSTNTCERTTDGGKDTSTTLIHTETLPYKPGTIDDASMYQSFIGMSQMKLTDFDQTFVTNDTEYNMNSCNDTELPTFHHA